MEGVQKLFFLPEAHTDFIFANIAEEMGFIGSMSSCCSLSFFGCARPAHHLPLAGSLCAAGRPLALR